MFATVPSPANRLMDGHEMSALPRLRPGLLRHELDKQVLVYDPRLDRVHLLDATTAFVFDLLERGEDSLDQMTNEIAWRNNVEPDPAFVSLAFEELRSAGLLDESEALMPALGAVTRRNLVRKLAMSGAAALLIPAVATLTATKGYAQLSITGGSGDPCIGSTGCGPGLVCCNGICSAGCDLPPDQPCTSDIQCASGICCPEEGLCASVPCNSVPACGTCSTTAECANPNLCGTTATRTCGGTALGNDRNKLPNGAACNGNGECCSNNCDNPSGPGGGVCV